jgi:hypothetical protein
MEVRQPRKLKYAVVIGRLKAWQLRCIQCLEESGVAALEAIVEVHEGPNGTFGSPKSQQLVDTPPELITRTPVLRAAGTRPQALELDFVLQLARSGPPPDFISPGRYGTWYFNFSDGNAFRSRAPYFWELYYDCAVSGAMLLRQDTNRASLGTVLAAGYFPTIRASYTENVDQCFFRSAGWPAKICRELVERGLTLDGQPVPSPRTTYGVPNFLARLSCSVRMLRNRTATFIQTFFWPYWNVALVSLPQARAGRVSEIRLLQPDAPAEYLADPFAYATGEKRYVFCERFSYARNRGNISFFELTSGGGAELVTAIEEPIHMSYPQVFESDGTIYCVPETSAANEVRAYKAVRFPTEWSLESVLLRDFSAIDPTIVRFNGRWWMFCTKLGEGTASDLYIWHADGLLGPWKQHARNPVKVDVRSARPAGRFFARNGELYRPAQDCSRSYGGRLVINKVSKLSDTEFEETVDAVVEPPHHGPYRFGLHTIAELGDVTIVDVKRYDFSRSAAMWYVSVAFSTALRKLGFSDSQISRLKQHIKRALGRGTSKRSPL